MTKQVTRWSPDTCECVIDFEWDDADSPEARQHTHKTSIKTCPAHSQHHGKPEHFTVVTEENQLKNHTLVTAAQLSGVEMDITDAKVRAKVAAMNPKSDDEALVFEHVLRIGMQAKANNFVSEFNNNYSFDSERKLHIKLPKLTGAQKNTLKSDKVIVDE
ncbi:MAG: hypothetical protein Q7R57_06655 [Dehalococcoidales bacterium]|nr:hypothetical protein [Dehalococcoidales bacterium]